MASITLREALLDFNEAAHGVASMVLRTRGLGEYVAPIEEAEVDAGLLRRRRRGKRRSSEETMSNRGTRQIRFVRADEVADSQPEPPAPPRSGERRGMPGRTLTDDERAALPPPPGTPLSDVGVVRALLSRGEKAAPRGEKFHQDAAAGPAPGERFDEE